MNLIFKIQIAILSILFLLSFPTLTYSQEEGPEVTENNEEVTETVDRSVPSGDGSLYPTLIDSSVNISDPALQDVTLLGLSIARFLVALSGGVVILMLCYGGFNYMSGYMQGSEDSANAGKTIITHAIIGLILILTSYLIVTMFQSTLTSKSFVEETQN